MKNSRTHIYLVFISYLAIYYPRYLKHGYQDEGHDENELNLRN